ncbi:hypothetical protein AVEN_75676-1 [Araneus ventricosus]|uniref:Uncharacterized protein n=1 Tax=Araneus ventricosus TaxID=182803 RepID=A0A4Y2D4X0_ARAVE|nr:hypothetical protein AVEN_75676-1 [Araneus ventricosus]
MSTAVRQGLTRERRKTFLSKDGLGNLRHSSLINPSIQELRYSTLLYIELFPKFEKSPTLSASINYGFLLLNGPITDVTTKTHDQQE